MFQRNPQLSIFRVEDGDSMLLQNISNYLNRQYSIITQKTAILKLDSSPSLDTLDTDTLPALNLYRKITMLEVF
jgi:hypothetical protein